MSDENPISQAEFTHIMNNMSEVFPAINGKARIKFYYGAVKDMPLKCLKDISKSFLMASKQMPLPSDFVLAVTDWKRTNKINSFGDEAPSPILCSKCNDLGIVRIQHHNDKKFDCLLNCDCKVSITKTLKTPIWGNDLLSAYIKTPCPVEWFVPPNAKEFDFKNLEITTIIKNWNARKASAEKYWRDMGYVHD